MCTYIDTRSINSEGLKIRKTSKKSRLNHRMVWVGRDLKDHLVPSPCHGQGHLPLAHAAQSSIQPGLEHCQGGGSHSFSRQPVPLPHHPHSEEFPSYI